MKRHVLPPLLLAELTRAGVMTRRRALILGAVDNDLERWVRQGLLVRVRGGVYSAPPLDASDNLVNSLRGAVAAGRDVVVSHRSAAWLHGLPTWGRLPRPEVTRSVRGSRIRGVVVHRYGVDADQAEEVGGLPVTMLERTLVDVCRVVPIPEALVAFDAALRDRTPDASCFGEILDSLGDINFRRRAIQTALWADGSAENPFESFSRGKLLLEGIPAPQLQWWVGDGAGTWFRPDKLWPNVGVVGEADGSGKYRQQEGAGPNALLAEKNRQEWFEDHDFVFVRWGVDRISHKPDLVAQRWRVLERRQRSRGWTWPSGVWLVCPGPWPPSRAFIRDESASLSTSDAVIGGFQAHLARMLDPGMPETLRSRERGR